MSTQIMTRKDIFTATELVEGLDMISSELVAAVSSSGLQIDLPLRIMVAGGAVSVLKYKTRETTRDVDFYHPSADVRKILLKLGKSVADAKNWEGAFYWFNEALVNIIEGDPAYSAVFANSMNSKDTVYSSESIVLVPVDINWQLHRKISRVSKYIRLTLGIRIEDMDDALYLLHLFHSSKGRALKKSEFRQMYSESTTARISDAAIAHIADTYRHRYNSVGLNLDEW
ncbi:hypothetical protein EW146_g479 [Bondarzewia mesenterica]|uniref:DUF7582 domain-containing protein n=1 Tax=Bondarzewia mesenterica TaxID=1095465 RepID=A0A4V3XGD7_9AGAM|nr:hypothetical protein EW146_g479 [Bondarzewia mesenterica]